jgi:phage shock protein A
MSEIATPGNTPSLDEVRDKIERRYANALGQAELAQNSVQGRMIEVEQAGVQMAGHDRLEQIRASMRGDALPAGGPGGTASTSASAPGTPAAAPKTTPAEKPIGQQ